MRILIAGDFVSSLRVKEQLNNGNFECLEDVTSLIKTADYSIVNLECPVLNRPALPIRKTGPSLSSNENALACIAKAGFKCVTLANNHFRDYGQIGVDDTLRMSEEYSLDYVGGGRNLKEAEEIKYINIHGKRLSIINICENEWSIASEARAGSAPLNPVRNFYKIIEAKKKSDFLIVIVHGGIEGYKYPTLRMVDTYRFFVDAGADAVINHHQHCYSGYEVYRNKPIFYGLGNFCFDRLEKNGSEWNQGYIVMLDLNDNQVQFEVIPYVQCADMPNVKICDERQRENFQNDIKQINTVIGDRMSLKHQYELYLNSISFQRLLNLEPFYNRYIRRLQRVGLLPRFIRGQTFRDWYNRLNCESHRDVLCALMQKHLED